MVMYGGNDGVSVAFLLKKDTSRQKGDGPIYRVCNNTGSVVLDDVSILLATSVSSTKTSSYSEDSSS